MTIASAHDSSFSDYVVVSATLESMAYTVSETESWAKVTDASALAAGDTIMITSESKGKIMGSITGSNKYAGEGTATFASSSATDVTGELRLTLGGSSGAWTLQDEDENYLRSTAAKSIDMNGTSESTWTIEISDGNATITFGSYGRILHNVSSTRFTTYTSDTSSSMLLPQIYKLSGGDTPYTVTEALFNGVHNNFGGEGATYEWDASCSNFDGEAWEDACDALKGITGYSTYKLNRAVGNIAGNEIEQFIAKYDIIIGKFGKTYDYLARFSNGGINANTRIDVNPIQLSAKNTSAVIIIVVISSISIAAFGGYFLFRKKKEQ